MTFCSRLDLLTKESVSAVSHPSRASILGFIPHLVTITPLEILGANVLVRVFSALLQRGQVAPVLPVLLPENPSVTTSQSEGRYDATNTSVSYQVGRKFPREILAIPAVGLRCSKEAGMSPRATY